jgi:hypothetical protein
MEGKKRGKWQMAINQTKTENTPLSNSNPLLLAWQLSMSFWPEKARNGEVDGNTKVQILTYHSKTKKNKQFRQLIQSNPLLNHQLISWVAGMDFLKNVSLQYSFFSLPPLLLLFVCQGQWQFNGVEGRKDGRREGRKRSGKE